MLRSMLLALCVVLGIAGTAWANAGDLDTTYGQGGAAIADFGPIENGAANDNVSDNALAV